MNKAPDILDFFNRLKLNSGAIWLEQNKIKLSAPKEFQNKETDELIINNKNEILEILEDNSIHSKKDFLATLIYRNKNIRYYPLSPAQERLWFIEQYEEGTNAYHAPIVFELNENTNKEGLKYALQQIVARHEILRSTIEQQNGQGNAIQCVHSRTLSIEEITLKSEENYEAIIKLDINKPFDLASEYPIRVKFYVCEVSESDPKGKMFLLVNIHHIACDGWSEVIFQKELRIFYEAYINKNLPFSLPSLKIQYKDYALWHKSYLTSEVLKNQLNYWKNKLSGYQTLRFPVDNSRPKQIDYRGSNVSFKISREITASLRAIAQKQAVTLRSVMLSSFNILLSKYTGQEDIVVGSITANRHNVQTKDMIGFFVNTQINRTMLNATQNFEELIQQVHAEQIEAQINQDIPFDKLVTELGVDRDTTRHPIFQIMFDFQSYDQQNGNSKKYDEHFQIWKTGNIYEVEKFDLSVNISDDADELSGEISYAISLFNKESIVKFSNNYLNLIEQLASNPNVSYSGLSILNSQDYKKIIHEWNSTESSYSSSKTIHDLFAEQALRTPENIALIFEEQELSYRVLDEKTNQLARYIRKKYYEINQKELVPDTLIPIYLDRGLEMVISVLAILKAGAAYVPIDPNYPEDRIDFILEDTSAGIILCQKHFLEKLPKNKTLSIDLDEELYLNEDTSSLPVFSNATNLAYVIYTSGTTGKPKGAMLNHQGIVNRIEWMQNMYSLCDKDVVLQKTPYVFDVSVWELLWANWYGAKIVMAKPEGHKDSDYLHQVIREKNVTTLHFVPSMLEAYNHYLINQNQKISTNVRQVFCSGEALPNNVVQQTFKNFANSNSKLHNLYGPTEVSVDVTYYETSPFKNVYIGKPISNTHVYILDTYKNPVPIGVVGELYLGGAGLARGYLNRTELSEERFVKNPFATENDKEKGYTRLYKTGDLVRWLPDGNIEYIGRNDDQVKIRGYRIELGEIENALLQIEGIKQSCVLAKERQTEAGRSKFLVGYYVGDALVQETVLNKLYSSLPEYMVPYVLVRMDSFPLTTNGKLDRRALPDPEFKSAESDIIDPSTETEILLYSIWQSVLGIEKISVVDNFFRIGGDSILSIQVSSRIRQAGYTCHVKDIFEYKTIVKLAEYLNRNKIETLLQTEQGILTGDSKLLPIQQWFFDKVDCGEISKPNHWNQSFLIRVPKLDIKKLELIIGELNSYHDALRIQFTNAMNKNEGTHNWKQSYSPIYKSPEIKILDIGKHNETEIREILTHWQSNFHLEKGNLFKVGYLHGYSDGSARIFFALHHLITDGVSWRILAEDIKTLYEGKSLPTKGSSYRQWVETIRDYPRKHDSEVTYWQKQIDGIPNYLSIARYAQSGVSFEIDKALTGSLLQDAASAYNTEVNDLLLTALGYALKEINHHDVQSITLEGHGREEIDTSIDHSRTLGWFTTVFPVKLEVKAELGESIRYIKETLRKIPNKGIGFGAFATMKENPFSLKNLAPISFNYLGQFDSNQQDWQIITEESGDTMHSANLDNNVININGQVSAGKLNFEVMSLMGEKVTKKLADSFKQQLIMITQHCLDKVNKEGTSFTPSDFQSANISQKLLDRLATKAILNKNHITHIFPATSLQQGFIYHALSQSEDDAYRVQQANDYYEPLDINLYLKAWEYCILQYPILRTAFNWEENIIQIIYKQGKLNYQIHDISQFPTQKEKDEQIKDIQENDRKRNFDLEQPTLLRLHIVKQAHDHYTIIKTVHHSVSDGWSGPILLENLHSYYLQLIKGKLPQVNVDTAYVQTQEYINKHKENVNLYWKKTLAEFDSANDINSLLSRPIEISSYKQMRNCKSSSIEITGQSYIKLKTFLSQEGITTNIIVQFVWQKLLQVYSNNPITVVGTTVSGRDLPINDIIESVGLYINTLPLLINWNNDLSIREQLHLIQHRITEMNTHSFADLAKLQNKGERMFHSLMIYENYPTSSEESGGLKISFRNGFEKTNYPLSVLAYEQENTISIILQYDEKYLEEDKAMKHLSAFKSIIEQVINNPNKSHNDISLLTEKEYQQVIHDWNSIEAVSSQNKTINDLFEEQVSKTPDNVALIYKGKKLTYRELNEKSNQLANYIRAQYLQRTKNVLKQDTLIALYLDRNIELVIGVLAVMKAGGAYVPIDSNYPQDRIDFILEDTNAEIILGQKHLIGNITLPKDKVLLVDIDETFYLTQNSLNLPKHSSADDLAYVIYTSGTTGKPKGVMQTHKNVARLFLSTDEYFKFNPNDVWTLYHSYAFDFSVWELWGALLYGGSLVIVSKEEARDTKIFYDLCSKNNVTVLNQTPSAFYRFADCAKTNNQNNLSLRYIIFGGEALNIYQLNNWWDYKKNNELTCSLVNMYGITETTVHVTYKVISENESVQSNIGRQLSDLKSYILLSGLQPAPIGVIGELYIGGAGLARGYLNRPELTAERFIENPFATENDKEKGYTRLYKTGDLVRWLPDGNIEYIGRNDDQVKIRGYRIELGEIENALLQVEGIKQCCVLVKERKTEVGNTKYLVGYYVVNNQIIQNLDQTVILNKLSVILPEHMLPSALVKMDSFPLTTNGKLDKRQLPDAEFRIFESDYVAPTTEIELLLCNIWQSVLGIERVSVADNFFQIGGDSILSIQVSSRIRQAGYTCNVRDIFEQKTVSRLADQLGKKQFEANFQIEDGILEGELGFLPIQRWFAERVEKGHLPKPHHWNMSFLVKTPQLDSNKVENIITQLASHHDILRVSFNNENQFYQSSFNLPQLKTLDVSKHSASEVQQILTDWQSEFNLERGFLFQVGYLYGYSDGSARIFFALHHLIVDGVSWRILAEDMKTLWKEEKLPTKGSSYRQWVEVVNKYPSQYPLELSYWKEQLQNIIDYPVKDHTLSNYGSFELNELFTSALLQEASKAYNTEVNDLLLTALAYSLREINNQNIQNITMEGHGRENINQFIDHSRTVGWFTTLFPLKLEVKDDLKKTIQTNKENLRRIPNKGIGFGAFAIKEEVPFSFRDLAPISFNYLGQFESKMIKQGDWQITDEDSGEAMHSSNSDHNIININGQVSSGKLKFGIISKLDEPTTKKITKSFQEHLITIIEHCQQKIKNEGGGFTPSDFGSVKISQSLLDKLQLKAKGI
jgi:amino acid adenylation domain-containing protein/non-ribosomal peptide synthase protein (TIGR01720 family)